MTEERCFFCKKNFMLNNEHRVDYRDTGLCPQCFERSLGYRSKLDIINDNIRHVIWLLEKKKGERTYAKNEGH
jgi:hypothetical protein